MVSLFLILFWAGFIFFGLQFAKNGDNKDVSVYNYDDDVDVDGNDGKRDGFYCIMTSIFGSWSIIFSIWFLVLINQLGTGATIDRKIEIYERENAVIEESISDTLDQEQIESYVANNQKIRKLKEVQIDLEKVKWKLYFGR